MLFWSTSFGRPIAEEKVLPKDLQDLAVNKLRKFPEGSSNPEEEVDENKA